MGKSTISMAIFNSKLLAYQRVSLFHFKFVNCHHSVKSQGLKLLFIPSLAYAKLCQYNPNVLRVKSQLFLVKSRFVFSVPSKITICWWWHPHLCQENPWIATFFLVTFCKFHVFVPFFPNRITMLPANITICPAELPMCPAGRPRTAGERRTAEVPSPPTDGGSSAARRCATVAEPFKMAWLNNNHYSTNGVILCVEYVGI